jgi:hypothetical protein
MCVRLVLLPFSYHRIMLLGFRCGVANPMSMSDVFTMSYYPSMYVPWICNVHQLKISYNYHQCPFTKWHYYTSYFSYSIDATLMSMVQKRVLRYIRGSSHKSRDCYREIFMVGVSEHQVSWVTCYRPIYDFLGY